MVLSALANVAAQRYLQWCLMHKVYAECIGHHWKYMYKVYILFYNRG